MRKLQKIGVFAPSSFVERGDIEAAQAVMDARGVEVFVHPQTFEQQGQLAGTKAQKLDALHALYSDPSIDAIWAAGGGNRALDLLDGLELSVIKANPKPMIGFSDVTALLNHITAHTGIVNTHAQVFKNLASYDQLDACLSFLSGEAVKLPLDQVSVIREGDAEGRLIGGNLSVFHYLAESLPPSYFEGAILCLEDCGEELSRIDRMLVHLKRSGVLSSISGLLLGEFIDMRDTGRPFGFSLEEIISEHCAERDMPIIMNAPFGHGSNLYPLPIGKNGKITQGSFEAWGSGFRYNYNDKKQALTVFHTNTERLLARFNFDQMLSKQPMAYVGFLEKASQINALMMSNNNTINLAETMELQHISPILRSIGSTSRHAFDLQNMLLNRFCTAFAKEFDLKSVKIKLFHPEYEESAFFIARIQTHHGNGFSTRACSLAGITSAMSDRTLRDLITMEFGHRFEASATNLLNASSRLTAISYILDESFVPKSKVLQTKHKKNQSINSYSTH